MITIQVNAEQWAAEEGTNLNQFDDWKDRAEKKLKEAGVEAKIKKVGRKFKIGYALFHTTDDDLVTDIMVQSCQFLEKI